MLVCAKNEAENLKKLIPLLLVQHFPKFEIILIDDNSTDDTAEVIQAFAAKDNRIKFVNSDGNRGSWGSKKYALTLGIQKAAHEILLFTDADCMPVSDQWIRLMTQPISKEKNIVLGYGGYSKSPNSWLNRIIRFETTMTALQYFAYATTKNPYMGVGRNLAYTTSTFFKNEGFTDHLNIPSGDDDLFVNKAATPTNTAICADPNAFTRSDPKKSWKDWFTQKKRHTAVAKYYKTRHKLQLGLFYLSQFFFFLFGVISLILWIDPVLILVVIFIRYLLFWLITAKAATKLKESDLNIWLPALEIFLVSLQMSIFISNTLVKPSRWK